MGKLKTSLIQNLNKPGRRWLLGYIFSTISSIKQSKSVSIRYDSKTEAWTHSANKHAYLVDVLPSYSANGAKYGQHVKDTFFPYYQPKNADVVFDIGAGVGTLIDPIQEKIGHEGQLFAIEAHPGTFNCLTTLTKLNGWKQVQPFNLAISNNSEPIFINDTENHSANSVLDEGGNIKVESITMDTLINQEGLERIDFIKMNIEGAEKLALEQMTETLKITKVIAVACHDQLARESGNEYYRTKQFVIDKLKSNGFEVLGEHFERVDHWVFAKRMNV